MSIKFQGSILSVHRVKLKAPYRWLSSLDGWGRDLSRHFALATEENHHRIIDEVSGSGATQCSRESEGWQRSGSQLLKCVCWLHSLRFVTPASNESPGCPFDSTVLQCGWLKVKGA